MSDGLKIATEIEFLVGLPASMRAYECVILLSLDYIFPFLYTLHSPKIYNMSIAYDVFRGSPEGNIVAGKVTQALKYNEVFINTIASGLCGTDEHFRKTNQALGHEGVGFVGAVGSSVPSLKIKDRAGFGFTHNVCASNDNCVTGNPSSIISVLAYDAGLKRLGPVLSQR